MNVSVSVKNWFRSITTLEQFCSQGGNSKKYLRQIIMIFVTLDLKILGRLRLKVSFLKEISLRLMLTTRKMINIICTINNCLVKAFQS